MPSPFPYDVFLSHSAKDKPIVRPLAERLRGDGLRVWFDEWEIKPGDSIPAKIEEGLEHSRVLVLCMSANAFGSDWSQLESGTFRFRDPLNKGRRFIPLRLDDAPIKGSLAQLLYINWHPPDDDRGYAKLLDACRRPQKWPMPSQTSGANESPTAVLDFPEPDRLDTELSPAKPITRTLDRIQPQRESRTGRKGQSRWTSCSHFFSDRFAQAFPGVRSEVVWFSDAEAIAERLDRLLQKPLRVGDYFPIWWFRGLSTNYVEHFRRLDSATWLLNQEELQIGRIGAVENPGYWQSFVYVEVKGAAPSGACHYSEEELQQMLELRGYCWEDLCLCRGRYLQRKFFEDGVAEIDGHLVDLGDEAELRQRYLSKYNFVLAGQDSSINNKNFDLQLQSMLNETLSQPQKFELLVQEVKRLPKQVTYFNRRRPCVE
jgi:hypothetical protein